MITFKLYSWFCFVIENWTCNSRSAFMMLSSHFRVSFVFFHFIIRTKFFIVFHKQQVSQFFHFVLLRRVVWTQQIPTKVASFQDSKKFFGRNFLCGHAFLSRSMY
ncbi:hypothetical protein CY35_06G095300 [Sphagnum magellanicum]|nr:hypothetical protein CY35_06G095300 [Sphagnum magellanicum]KAH9560223.1 hypothetical protein CY35_06G095300 [Sphagnum magellanicum]